MYVSMKDMLQHASEHKYAVMAVNCINYVARHHRHRPAPDEGSCHS